MDTLASLIMLGVLALGVVAFIVVIFVACEIGGEQRWKQMTDEERENEMWAAYYLMNPNDPIWPRDPFSGRR